MTTTAPQPTAHKVPKPKFRPVLTLAAFYLATLVVDVILLTYAQKIQATGATPPAPLPLRMVAHAFIDLLPLAILYFAMNARAKKHAIEERPWFVAAGAGVIFAALLYAPSLMSYQVSKPTDPSNLEGTQGGSSWPILVYFLFPLAASVMTTRRRRATDAH